MLRRLLTPRREPISRRVVPLVALSALLGAVACQASTTVASSATASSDQAVPARAVSENTQARPRVLFIRGATGTAPAGGGPPNADALSDITNLATTGGSNGFGSFARALADAGYDVSQLNETGTADSKIKVDLQAAGLKQYAVVIFGSNNALYNQADATLLTQYVQGGGGVLFMSDTNWGRNAPAAPSSDTSLLTGFGITMNQDNGQAEEHTSTDAGFVASHPVLQGVDRFASVGTSACQVTSTAPNVAKQVLVPYTAQVQTAIDGAGNRVLRAADANDGTLVVFEAGQGRGACLDDRDEFLNPNLDTFSHQQLGLNLVNWLAGRS